MKVVNTERVWRYHVRFGVEETAFLRGIGFLPPQPNTLAFPTDEAEMWVTREELSGLDMIAEMPEWFRAAIRDIAGKLASTEQLWPEFAERALREVTPIVTLAQEIGLHWRQQEGVNGALLDRLAELTEPES